MSDPTTENKADRLAEAFLKFKKGKPEFSWDRICSVLENSNKKFNTGLSKATIEGLFGKGGPRSRLKNASIEGKRQIYDIQVAIICELNEKFNLRIAFVANEPTIDAQGELVVEQTNKKNTKLVSQKDLYKVFYCRADNNLGKGILSLSKSGDNNAELTIFYDGTNSDLLLEGSYISAKGIVTVRLHRKFDKEFNPFSQIVFFQNSDSLKDCYVASYATLHKREHTYASGGAMLVFSEKRMTSYTGLTIENLATYFLVNNRFKAGYSGFNFIQMTNNSLITENKQINSFFEVVKFAGIYRGFFINGKTGTYETCIIKIDDTGQVDMLAFERLTYPFKGLAKLHNNKDLIINYDYIQEIDEYRIRLIFETSNQRTGKTIYLHGVMSGLELQTKDWITSTMILENIDKDIKKDIMLFSTEVKCVNLTNGKGFGEFESDMTIKRLYGFFLGIDDDYKKSTSISFLNQFKR